MPFDLCPSFDDEPTIPLHLTRDRTARIDVREMERAARRSMRVTDPDARTPRLPSLRNLLLLVPLVLAIAGAAAWLAAEIR